MVRGLRRVAGRIRPTSAVGAGAGRSIGRSEGFGGFRVGTGSPLDSPRRLSPARRYAIITRRYAIHHTALRDPHLDPEARLLEGLGVGDVVNHRRRRRPAVVQGRQRGVPAP
eukprot:2568881-Pyramimonas_sp.AAC.1